MREHRKKQRVLEPIVMEASEDAAAEEEEILIEIPVGAGTALPIQTSGSASCFERHISSKNAKLYLGCVNKALNDPLPADRLANLPKMSISQQRELLFQYKQKVPFHYILLMTTFFFFGCLFTSLEYRCYNWPMRNNFLTIVAGRTPFY